MIPFFHHRTRMARRLADFHAGDLPPAAYDAISRHLRACAECRAELRALETTEALLRGTAPRVSGLSQEASRALFDRALAESGVLQRHPMPRWQLYAWATPAVLALLGGGLALLKTYGPTSTSARQIAGGLRPVVRIHPETLSRARPLEPVDTAEKGELPGDRTRAAASHRPERPAATRGLNAGSNPLVAAPRMRRRHPVPEPPQVTLAVVPLEKTGALDWKPEPSLAPGPGIERLALVDDREAEAPEALAAPDEMSRPRLAGIPALSEVDVQVTAAQSRPLGTARAAAWWMEPTGEWFLKLAQVPQDEDEVELLLVSLSRERIWGYWKEETE